MCRVQRVGVVPLTVAALVAAASPGGLLLCAQPASAPQPEQAQLQLSIQLPQRRVYAGVPLAVSLKLSNGGAAEATLSKYGIGRGRGLDIVCRDERGKAFRPPSPGGVLDYWRDVYYVPPRIPPRTTWAALDMLLLPTAGAYTLEASLKVPDGPLWAADPVSVTAQPFPADDPYFGLVYGLGLLPRLLAEDAVYWFYLAGWPQPPATLQQTADALFEAHRGRSPSLMTEAFVAVDILASARLELLDHKPRMPRADLIYRCTWFEQTFPHSFLLPEVRYRKALLLAAEGQQDEAKALLRKERERSPIARLLYHNLASMSADAARLLREEE